MPFYIDTSSINSKFCMPNIDVPYEEWLMKKYKVASTVMDGRPAFYGIAQHINHLIFEARERKSTVIAFGQHAKEAAKVIEEIASYSIDVEVAK